ncbi:unnamed protein product, partial [Owenia fusiformis]
INMKQWLERGNNDNNLWRISVPDVCLIPDTSQGYLIGHYNINKHSVIITGVVHTIDDVILRKLPTSPNFGILGELSHETGAINLKNRTFPYWISIDIIHSDLPKITMISKSEKNGHAQELKLLIIIYNPGIMFASKLLESNLSDSESILSVNNLKYSQTEMYKLKHLDIGGSCITNFCPDVKKSGFSIPMCIRAIVINQLVSPWFKMADNISHSKLWKSALFQKALYIPCVTCQLQKKFSRLRNVLFNEPVTDIDKLRCRNERVKLLLDTILGIVVMFVLTQSHVTHDIATDTLSWAEIIATRLQHLLQWMMGVPAGLKLNSQLDQLLGKFFLYHIYLWRGYLAIIGPVLGHVLWYISMMGVFGLTIQLSLVQDVFSMMTLHIYCFYVYAARLYSLQIYGLASLWRLFRGKKWNVLRRRVDTATFDVDQLFLGTLLFTILLFLLPTTALYYVVFTLLRVVVLMIQGTIHAVVRTLNKLLAYILVLRLIGSNTLSNQTHLTVLPVLQGRPLYLSMQVGLPSYSELLEQFHISPYEDDTSDSWSMIGQKLIHGDLIYPWIDRIRT